MNERCCEFGEGGHLAGIVTEPAHAPANRGALVLVSAGLVPKFGPFRLYAELARRLSHEGFVTLRFDLGGIGDSTREISSLPLKKRTELEIRAALDWVTERYGARNVVLGGLCSGAEDSFRAAELDARVSGVVMIDPFAYRTAGFLPRHLLHRVVRRARRAVGHYQPSPPPRVLAEAHGGAKPLVSYEYMAREESSRILRSLVDRRARVHFVYTGGAHESFNHEGQVRAMFRGTPLGDLVTVDYLPEMDHTQMLAEDRERLVEAIARRLAWSGPKLEPGRMDRASGFVVREGV
jgi:alpha-beta hydrolase superfamily lysophospholipase